MAKAQATETVSEDHSEDQASVFALPVISSDIPMPELKRAGRKTVKYPIEQLEVGQSFHVAKSAEVPDPASTIQSTVSNIRAKYSVPEVDADGNPVMEMVSVRVYQKDASGKLAKDENGKRILLETKTEEVQAVKLTRDFIIREVGSSDPYGEGARVWRKL